MKHRRLALSKDWLDKNPISFHDSGGYKATVKLQTVYRQEMYRMRQASESAMIRARKFPRLFLAIVPALVYGLAAIISASKAQNIANEKPGNSVATLEILRDIAALPPPVAKMRSEILGAAASGDIERMRVPVDLNEIPPMVTKEKTGDLAAYWKSVSGDGQGREIMAVAIETFRAGFVRKPQPNGGAMYVWPYFAELPLDKLTPAQEVELLTLVSPARLKEMRAKGQYDGYRIGIAQDGVWHFFTTGAQ